jgi:hypothetical protein
MNKFIQEYKKAKNFLQEAEKTNNFFNTSEEEIVLHLFQHDSGCEFTVMPKSNLAPFQRDIYKECNSAKGDIYKGSWEMREDGFMLVTSFLATCRGRKLRESTQRLIRLMDSNFERDVA